MRYHGGDTARVTYKLVLKECKEFKPEKLSLNVSCLIIKFMNYFVKFQLLSGNYAVIGATSAPNKRKL